jgi:hypothetical protein
MASGVALAGASLAGANWILVAIASACLALWVVGAKSRGYVEISHQSVIIAPKGDMGGKVTYAKEVLRLIRVGDGPILIFELLAGGSRSFGPWVTAWGRPTGMIERCRDVVAAFDLSRTNE